MTIPVHPNVALLERLSERIPHDLANAQDLIADDFVWHFFNLELPEVQGDYVGLDGLQTFFAKLAALTKGTFQAAPVAVNVIGDELVVTHVRDQMQLGDQSIELDAVVVWRIVRGRIAEAWDIPAIHTVRTLTQS